MFISIKKDVKYDMYEYYIPEGKGKKQLDILVGCTSDSTCLYRVLIIFDTWSHVAVTTTPLHVWMVGSVG
jgi:hypothetical protein